MNKREEILDKIRKCLDLAASSNEHEAAAALRQAQRMMELHNISGTEMLAAGVSEAPARSQASGAPSLWENDLAQRIADAFGCELIFSRKWSSLDMSVIGTWQFVGLSPANTVAAYAFEVLLRQALKARRQFIAEHLKRVKKRANKTARADIYSLGWVVSARAQLSAPTQPEGAAEAIAAYMELHHSDCATLKAVDRTAGRTSDKDRAAFAAGRSAGRDARVNDGVGAQQPHLLGGAA